MIRHYPVFISPQAQQELTGHLRTLLDETTDKHHAAWVIEQLKDFLVNKLSTSPNNVPRQDVIHQGIRVVLYGFYEIYYYFNGENIYVAHVAYKKALIH